MKAEERPTVLKVVFFYRYIVAHVAQVAGHFWNNLGLYYSLTYTHFQILIPQNSQNISYTKILIVPYDISLRFRIKSDPSQLVIKRTTGDEEHGRRTPKGHCRRQRHLLYIQANPLSQSYLCAKEMTLFFVHRRIGGQD